jgi:hypothetical protein
MATWSMIQRSTFYKENEILLSNKDAAKNGRAYKPYVIKEALDQLADGDFLIYTDCSPEMWDSVPTDDGLYKIHVLQDLCNFNNGILTCFVRWDTRPIVNNGLGIHTHRNFTTDRCIIKMGARQWEDSYMHASGMIVLQKNTLSKMFVEEWLHFNLDPDCCALGNPNIEDDYSYWDEYEKRYKMGHRHDQSISGILLNFHNPKLIDTPKTEINPYNFLNYCKIGADYNFIDSNTLPPKRRIKKGMDVLNYAGIKLRVFEIWPSANGLEKIIVGRHRESAYQTTEDKLQPI